MVFLNKGLEEFNEKSVDKRSHQSQNGSNPQIIIFV